MQTDGFSPNENADDVPLLSVLGFGSQQSQPRTPAARTGRGRPSGSTSGPRDDAVPRVIGTAANLAEAKRFIRDLPHTFVQDGNNKDRAILRCQSHKGPNGEPYV